MPHSNLRMAPEIIEGDNNVVPQSRADIAEDLPNDFCHMRSDQEMSDLERDVNLIPVVSSTPNASSAPKNGSSSGQAASTCAVARPSSPSVSESKSSSRMAASSPDIARPDSPQLLEDGHSAPDQGEGIAEHEETTPKVTRRSRQHHLSQEKPDGDAKRAKDKIRWKDVWVSQLIHIRGRMHPTFCSSQRRVDLWQVVEREMANTCLGFDKDSEACRKKWLRVCKEYKEDLHLSDKEEAHKCRFYELMDFYVGDQTSKLRVLYPHAVPIAKESPRMLMKRVAAKGRGRDSITLHRDADVVDPPRAMKKPRRFHVTEKPQPASSSHPKEEDAALIDAARRESESGSGSESGSSSIHTMLSELVMIGKEMLVATKAYEKEKLSVLRAMKDMLGRIVKNM